MRQVVKDADSVDAPPTTITSNAAFAAILAILSGRLQA